MAQRLWVQQNSRKEKGVVAEMRQITCGDGARRGAYGGQSQTHSGERGDLSPAAAELGHVNQTEQDSGKRRPRNDSKFPRQHRINVAAEHGLLRERGNEYPEGHQIRQSVGTGKQILYGQMLFSVVKQGGDIGSDAEYDAAGQE